jgi:integrase
VKKEEAKIIGGPPWRWQVRFVFTDGTQVRERRRSKLTQRDAALREAKRYANELREAGPAAYLARKAPEPEPAAPEPAPTVPTLAEFAPAFLAGHCTALQQKKSGVDAKRGHIRKHLIPAFGTLRLDEITTERVATFQAGLAERGYGRKSIANVLVTLAKILRVAIDWEKIPAMPCKIKPPKSRRATPTFYELDRMRRLIDAAKAIDARTHALILIGLHGGLRRSEILGLEWADVNTARRQLVVRRAAISKYVDTPKSGHGRVLELSAELTDALDALAKVSPKTGRVFLQDSGKPALAQHLYRWTEAATKAAGIIRRKGERLHVMRHSACSALAAMGAPTIAIQGFAGHETPQTTEKYMHLAPGAQRAAVDLFDRAAGNGHENGHD